jgi:hypothetical protein
MDLLRDLLGAMIALAVLVFREYVWYHVNFRSRKRVQQPRLHRLSPARRRALYAARRKRARPYTGKTQRLSQ